LNRHLQQEGTSLKSILTQSRIEEAKKMLVDNKFSIEQIAMKIGFSGLRIQFIYWILRLMLN